MESEVRGQHKSLLRSQELKLLFVHTAPLSKPNTSPSRCIYGATHGRRAVNDLQLALYCRGTSHEGSCCHILGTTSQSKFTQFLRLANIISTINNHSSLIFKIPKSPEVSQSYGPLSQHPKICGDSSVVFGMTVPEHHRAAGFDVPELSAIGTQEAGDPTKTSWQL